MGTAFFLFLALAIVPISLRAAGVQLSISPRLSAAIDAWHQIAEVVGSSYQTGSETSAPSNPSSELSKAADEIACPREIAMLDALEQVSQASHGGVEVSFTKAESAREGCPRAASRASAEPKRVEPLVVSAKTELSFKKQGRAIEVFSATTLENIANCEVLRHIERQVLRRGFERSRLLPIPKDIRVLLNLKPSISPSAIKAAQGRVRTALEAERRHERVRAPLVTPVTTDDNCEF
jgi:hypothetical protein